MSLTQQANPGLRHVDLEGAERNYRYRPERIDAASLGGAVTCALEIEATPLTSTLVDASPTGACVRLSAPSTLAPGTIVERMILSQDGRTLWEGSAQVVWQVAERVGVKFTKALLDKSRLPAVASSIEAACARDLEQHDAWHTHLPAAWRAEVAALRTLLESARRTMNAQEQQSSDDDVTSTRRRTLASIVSTYFKGFSPTYFALLRRLHALSKELPAEHRELAASYARHELLPYWRETPIGRRAHEKPLGYAGDYKLMLMYISDELLGDTLFGKFLTYTARQHSLGQAVSAREKLLRGVIHEQMAKRRPVRIVSLACGPAVEIGRAIDELTTLEQPLEVVLIDQDEDALSRCYASLNERLIERHQGRLPITIKYLHFSVKQLIKPKTQEERATAQAYLAGADLIYSSGLVDYLPMPVAQGLVRRLYDLLGPDGRLLVGNMAEAPDTSWLLEYVVAWHLQYRDPNIMREMAAELPQGTAVDVVTEATGKCMFLDVRRGG